MKRNPKPFSVEIKKSRGPNQRHQLLPRRLFEMVPVETTQVFQKEEPQAVAEPAAAPRILPSIVEPVWSNSEAVEPVRRRRRSGSKADQGQAELDRNPIADGTKDAPAETPMILEAVSQMDTVVVEEAAAPVHEAQPQQTARAKAKLRKKAAKMVRPAMASEPVSQPEQSSETEVIDPLPAERARTTHHLTPTKRQAAAAQLPRHERWKRRLHPAAW
ncbi:hypothetical protein [Microvirga tunisiensis]|uniref:Uncharacterized protein n=1 Tax=Microvirga tunisiensis TaxID=2108360 RepID=A0A5N7MUF6_9HYPH|nr:hypothetical protein [Microvirga tunisiensis]MPR12610.1 hypothetical protein [Microvirga tunisiensis]MPR30518.1 hypothetical protein [Microvirga tunisiensis]